MRGDSAPRASAQGPMRTCVGCKRREHQLELLRVVVQDDEGSPSVVLDTHRRLPGRGAWFHADQECLQVAVRRRAFHRALRVTGVLDVDQAALSVAIPSST